MTRGTAQPRTWLAAVGVLFTINGFAWANWVPRIPEIQRDLDLSIATLGLVLAAYGAGGFLGSALSGPIIDLLGSRAAAGQGTVAIGVSMAFIALAPNAFTIAGVLLVVGTVDAIADLGMNAQAAEAQSRHGRWLMGRFHAMWSLGTLIGAAAGSVASQLAIPLGAHLGVVAVLTVTTTLWSLRHLEPIEPVGRVGAKRSVSRRALVLAGLAVAVGVGEGSAGDWSAVISAEIYGLGAGAIGLAFVGFSGAMLLGRLGTDRVIEVVGAGRMALLSSGTALVGTVAIVATPNAVVALVGFVALGFGMAALFPILYNTAASAGDTSAGTGLALMSVGGRVGFILGPVLIGWISETTDLRIGFGAVVILATLIIGSAASRFGTVEVRQPA